MSHHVAVTLAPVRDVRVMADYRQPIAGVMVRMLRRVIHDGDHPKAPPKVGSEPDLADKRMLAEALDWTPGLFCEHLTGCTSHGPAEPGPFTPAPYVHPTRGPGGQPMVQETLL